MKILMSWNPFRKCEELAARNPPFTKALSGRNVKLQAILVATTLVVAAVGCDTGPKSARGFRLPDGNADKGKAAFISLQCYTCHKVDGVDLPPPGATVKAPVLLGGEVTRIKTYGELVTSVINPSHKLSEKMKEEWSREAKLSPMPEFNDIMTVSQMIDLVAFLQPRYKKLVLDYEYYP
jgi:mono/diheme cytochrome c family protein